MKTSWLAGLLVTWSTIWADAESLTQQNIEPSTSSHYRHDQQSIFPVDKATWLLVWSQYYTEHSQENGQADRDVCHIYFKTSADQGGSWGKAQLLQKAPGAYNAKQANLLRLGKSDSVLFFYTLWFSNTSRVVYVRRSNDNCRSFSSSKQISEQNLFTCINSDHVIRLRSGRIILPAFSSPTYISQSGAPPPHWLAYCFYSDDEGLTWTRSDHVMDLPETDGLEEPSIVELKNGDLLAVLRFRDGHLYRAVSNDRGSKWGLPAIVEGVKAPQSTSIIKRLPKTDDLLLVWNDVFDQSHHHGGVRNPLSTAISQDEGNTWIHPRKLVNAPGLDSSSPAVTFFGDNAVVTYSQGSETHMGLASKTVPIQWFYESD